MSIEPPAICSGRVVRGQGRGRQLGFPTANLAVDEACELPMGVFIARVQGLSSAACWAVVNVGRRPTFAGREITVEVHILDFQGDLYGRELEVALIHKLREERAFAGPDELAAQIRTDIHQARALCAARHGGAQPLNTEIDDVDNH